MDMDEREALRRARELIKNKESNRICYALGEVGVKNQRLNNACIRLRGFIMKQIAPSVTFEGWQDRKGFGRQRTSATLRRDRLDWIDWMLEEGKFAPKKVTPRRVL